MFNIIPLVHTEPSYDLSFVSESFTCYFACADSNLPAELSVLSASYPTVIAYLGLFGIGSRRQFNSALDSIDRNVSGWCRKPE